MKTKLLAVAVTLGLPAVAFSQDQPTTQTEVSRAGGGPSAQANLVFKAFGGVEGYTGALATRVDPGPNYGANVAYEGLPALGIELGYSGAMNELKTRYTGGADVNPGGADLIRNGGYLVLTPGVPLPTNASGTNVVKPYVLAGGGIDNYSPRGNSSTFGYRDQVVGTVPIGAGVEAKFGSLRADARFNYAYSAGSGFYAFDNHPWRYQGTLQLGAGF